MKTSSLILFIILISIYLLVLAGLLYLSYSYIKYVNKLEKENCKCSEDTKREMIKNFSYLILGSWVLLIVAIMICPPKQMDILLKNKFVSLLNVIIIGSYAYLLFTYSKKLIDESCKCSESWVREAMQYHSYVYISLCFFSFMMLLIRIFIGNDRREINKLISVFRN